MPYGYSYKSGTSCARCHLGGTVAVAPPPFRPGNPAICGSHPLDTPYYCRLGDLLCFVFICGYCIFVNCVFYVFLQYFDTVGWVFWPVNRLPDNLYCVGEDVKLCSLTYSLSLSCHVLSCNGRHRGFDSTGNSAIWSADPENPTLERNMKWIGWPVAEIWPFEIRHITRGAFGTAILEGEVVGSRRSYHSKERCNLPSNVCDA